jgi:hypothetical protein
VSPELARAFWRVFRPTSLQVLASVSMALSALIVAHSQSLLALLSIGPAAIDHTRQELLTRFNAFLTSGVTSNLALITFWAAIGLVVYLVCWGGYNTFVTARNQVALQTQYTNQGPAQGLWFILGIKLAAILLLVGYLSVFTYGLSWWLALSAAFVHTPDIAGVSMAFGAVLGLAAQLYGVLVFIQLIFTPWYAQKPFTD